MSDLGEVISGLGRFLGRSDSLLTAALTLMGQVSLNMAEATSELVETLDDLNEGMETFKSGLERGVDRFESTGVTVEALASRLDTLSEALIRGEGTAGKLMRDETLYERADSTLKTLQDLLRDIQENPGRYITVKVF
jgi:phospholipid/cholesterol/gamma-HCH transport system substrate-binding protein